MLKWITFTLAAVPVVLFLKSVFIDRSKKRKQALADFGKQVDLLVTIMLVLFGCAVVYSVVKFLLS